MGQPKTVSKAMFLCVALSFFFVCALAEYPLAVVLARELGPQTGLWIAWLALFSLSSSWLATAGLFKLLGMSLSGTTLEIRGRAYVPSEGDGDHDEVVEVHNSRGMNLWYSAVMWLCLLFSLAIILLVGIKPPPTRQDVVSACIMVAFFGSGALFIRWGKARPSVRADARGIHGYPLGLHFRRRFVPWSVVATCEIRTVYDTYGTPTAILPILKDGQGRVLMVPNLVHTRFEDQERLARYIRAKLPKAKDDYFE
jgi:hypothetical protein